MLDHDVEKLKDSLRTFVAEKELKFSYCKKEPITCYIPIIW